MTDAPDRGYVVSDYLLDRLAELGVDRIFGVPGDFTLGFLDHVEDHERIEWIGTANELGAGYAADGYARLRGLGVVCTTFGVGELSAINAVAGAYAEHVPLLSLVGSPSELVQRAGRATHHSLGDGDFGHTLRMSTEVTVAQAMLTAENARAEIDRVLAEIVRTGQPGYLSLPTNVGETPASPPAQSLVIAPSVSDPVALQAFTVAAETLLRGAARPVVLADILVNRCHAEDALHRLLAEADLQFASMLWGRGVIDEAHPNYAGMYIGAASEPEVRAVIEDAPRLITAGVYFTDLTSGFFSQHLDDAHRVDLLPHSAVVAGRSFAGVEMKDALAILTDILRTDSPAALPTATPLASPPVSPSAGPLSQDDTWRIVADFLGPGDLVFADQGTAFYGMGAHRLHHDVLFVGQPLWASIGYALPALLGGALAAPERRPVLLIGDGAAQLTIGELGTIVRLGIPAIILVINNDGYTVERAIHGPGRQYNNIAAWHWQQLPRAFGASKQSAFSVRVETAQELAGALRNADEHRDALTFIEVVTDRLDVPPLLTALAAAAAAANAPKN
ncbi:MAG: thiamine pyrophosphate-binding protein [Pseudolysinimonas sp.]